MHDFTPWSALAGGVLIGIAASLLLALSGRVAGVSGILFGVLVRTRAEVGWRALFLAGLLVAGLLALWVEPESIGPSPRGLVALAVAGLLVGAGTRLGGGCTSGHGVCGISRLSLRSLLATFTFMLAGIGTVWAVRTLGGGS